MSLLPGQIITETNDFYVSTANTPDHGWETMVFRKLENGKIDWTDLYDERYDMEAQAIGGHAITVSLLLNRKLPLRPSYDWDLI